ncbi:MAG TPA: glycosyltransferase family 39 protein [Rubrivivax sp.]|nr:glycosyltransferase family 39 protein [Rubrivivax sp.]
MPSSISLNPPGRAAIAWADHRLAAAALIAGFTLLRLVLAATAPLLPQEAYYWSWSLHPAPGYFDHPPLASWGIWLSTALAGPTAFGIKLSAVLWSLGLNLLWARLVLDMYGNRRVVFWSLLALNLTLLYQIFGIGPTPDAPLLFGWVGAIWAVWRASSSGKGRWWLLAGVFAGIGLLGKYSAVLLGPVVLLYLAATPSQRHWLRTPWPWLALLIAVAMFTPVLWWNAHNQWASFAFQGARRVGQMGNFQPRNFFLLLLTQLLLVTPWLFALSLRAFAHTARETFAGRTDARTRLLLASAAVPLLLFTAVSLRSLVKLNWLAPAWWSLIVLGMARLVEQGAGARRLKLGLGSSAAVVLAAALLALTPRLPLRDLNTWSGWDDTARHVQRQLQQAQARGEQAFVFSPNYKISSLLRFYLPGQPRTYAQDIYGAPALQFDHFPLPGDLRGATGILVLSDQSLSRLDLERVKPYFETLEKVDTIETHAFGRLTRRVELWRGTGYKGHPRLRGLQDTPGGDAEPEGP